MTVAFASSTDKVFLSACLWLCHLGFLLSCYTLPTAPLFTGRLLFGQLDCFRVRNHLFLGHDASFLPVELSFRHIPLLQDSFVRCFLSASLALATLVNMNRAVAFDMMVCCYRVLSVPWCGSLVNFCFS